MQGVLEIVLHLRQGAHQAGGFVLAGGIYPAGQLTLGDGIGHGQGVADRLGQATGQTPGQQQGHQHRQQHDADHDADAAVIDAGGRLPRVTGAFAVEIAQAGQLLLIAFGPLALLAIGQPEGLGAIAGGQGDDAIQPVQVALHLQRGLLEIGALFSGGDQMVAVIGRARIHQIAILLDLPRCHGHGGAVLSGQQPNALQPGVHQGDLDVIGGLDARQPLGLHRLLGGAQGLELDQGEGPEQHHEQGDRTEAEDGAGGDA